MDLHCLWFPSLVSDSAMCNSLGIQSGPHIKAQMKQTYMLGKRDGRHGCDTAGTATETPHPTSLHRYQAGIMPQLVRRQRVMTFRVRQKIREGRVWRANPQMDLLHVTHKCRAVAQRLPTGAAIVGMGAAGRSLRQSALPIDAALRQSGHNAGKAFLGLVAQKCRLIRPDDFAVWTQEIRTGFRGFTPLLFLFLLSRQARNIQRVTDRAGIRKNLGGCIRGSSGWSDDFQDEFCKVQTTLIRGKKF